MTDELDDLEPDVRAQIERGLAPYVGRLSKTVLAEMRRALIDLLTTHPIAVAILREARPRSARAESGKNEPAAPSSRVPSSRSASGARSSVKTRVGKPPSKRAGAGAPKTRRTGTRR